MNKRRRGSKLCDSMQMYTHTKANANATAGFGPIMQNMTSL